MVLPMVPMVCQCVCSRFYQWYQWYTKIVQGYTNGTIGNTNGTIGNTIGTKGNSNGTIGPPNGTIGTNGKPMVPLVKFPMVPLGEPRTHAVSFKVLPMVPLVIPLVPMVPLVKTVVSQYCRQPTAGFALGNIFLSPPFSPI